MRTADDAERFTLLADGKPLGELVVPLAVHAATNATGAAALALELGVPFDAVAAALRGFGGVARRFERRGELDGVTFVDDYAHLPGEVAARSQPRAEAAGAASSRCSSRTATRTATLWRDFAGAFDEADAVVLTDVYAGRRDADRGRLRPSRRARGRRRVARVAGHVPPAPRRPDRRAAPLRASGRRRADPRRRRSHDDARHLARHGPRRNEHDREL